MSILKDAINALDPTPSKKKEITLTLDLLYELAEQKKIIQEEWLKTQLRTAGSIENPSIPITNTVAWHSETRAYVKDNAANLVDTITGAIKKFISGGANDIMDGIGDLLAGGINAILGSGSGEQKEMHSYFIVVEAFSIMRFDLTAWQRRIEVEGITSSIENAMTFTAVKSSVDVDKITFNTFLQSYKTQLEKMQFGDDEIIEFIKKSKAIFELLKDNSKSLNTAPLLQLPSPGTINLF